MIMFVGSVQIISRLLDSQSKFQMFTFFLEAPLVYYKGKVLYWTV